MVVMLPRLVQSKDSELAAIWFATVGSLTLTQMQAVLSVLALASTIVYTWLRIAQRIRRPRKEDEE